MSELASKNLGFVPNASMGTFEKRAKFHIKELLNELKAYAEVYNLNYDFIEKHGYIAGGCFTSILNEEKINDFDFYFDVPEATDILQSLTRKNYYNHHISENALTVGTINGRAQFITFSKGNIQNIVDRFDFRHTQIYYHIASDTIYYRENAYNCAQSKALVVNSKCSYPLNALQRVTKFCARGFTMESSEYVKLAYLITHVDFSKVANVVDQMRGMYGKKAFIQYDTLENFFKEVHTEKFSDKVKDIIDG